MAINLKFIKFVVVLSLSHVWLFVTPWTTAHQALLYSTISWRLLKFRSIELVMLRNHLILCCPLLLLSSIFSNIRIFSNESALTIRWPKYWSFCFSIRPANEYSGLISFRMKWLDLLAVQRTLKSSLQHHKIISSSVLGLLYASTLTSLHDYWKNYSFNYTYFYWWSDVSAF